MAQPLDILHSDGNDSVVLCDPITHDDIAEVFHCERHTVTQTREQALELAAVFASAVRISAAFNELHRTGEELVVAFAELGDGSWTEEKRAAYTAFCRALTDADKAQPSN